MPYHVAFEPLIDEGPWWGAIPDLPGCFFQFADADSATAAAKDALSTWLEHAKARRQYVPFPSPINDLQAVHPDLMMWSWGLVTSLLEPIDWEHNNRTISSFCIYDLVGLSLGYEQSTCTPIMSEGHAQSGQDAEYETRAIATYEAVHAGVLEPIPGSNMAVGPWHGQWIEVGTAAFRAFCDERGWNVPKEFRPQGYTPALPMKKTALVAKHRSIWPRIENDLSDAGRNGLAAHAKAGAQGWWPQKALAWARSKGRVLDSGPQVNAVHQALTQLPRRQHVMQR